MSIPSNMPPVKPRRRYDSKRRQAQAVQTRQDIVAAGLKLFVERGYGGTTLVEIANEAEVVVETIYRAFGGKNGLFKSVVEAAVAASPARADLPVEQRPAIKALIEETDPRRQLELHAATQPGIHSRVGPLFRVLREAAAADPQLDEVWNELEAERLEGMRRLAQFLADRGTLRPGLTVDEAADMLWTVNSLAVFDLLVLRRGWSHERYRDWVASTNANALLPKPDSARAIAPGETM